MKTIALAMYSYHYAHGHFSPAATYDKDGRPLLGWRVLILPYFGEEQYAQLYKEFKLDEPWDSPHNKALLPRMPSCYRYSSREWPLS